MCGQCDASLFLAEGTVEVGDEVPEFLVLQEVECFIDNQLFGKSLSFLYLIYDHLQGDDGYQRKIFFLRGIFHVKGYQPVMYDIHVFGSIQQE